MDTPGELRNFGIEERVEALERRLENIINIEEKLDCVLKDNNVFGKEVYNLTKENCCLLKEKMDLEKMESKFCEGEKWGKQACISLIDLRFKEVHTNLIEIIKQQEKEKSELAQSEIVKVIQQKETMVRNNA
ncbi:hypothetical protein E2C01_046905 [Portunus trituberculatus]|uniref:Uncharacterized protein n=1 Tax=Portunus trituberculatus TaxID=210409 RepID=A0A5B7FZS4_PORTR|nr:hypothetical protein [Portunus trituberculatus]